MRPAGLRVRRSRLPGGRLPAFSVPALSPPHCPHLRSVSSDCHQLESQRVRLGKATAAEALAFVKANHGMWVEWLKKKNLYVLGSDPARLGPAAHVLFHKDAAGQPGADTGSQSSFAVRRGCTARLATYNVLCSELSEPDYFTKCNPVDLDPETRYRRVLARLGPEMERNAVICLQEVSREWAGRLHSFFAQRGYHFVMDGYSKQPAGYMGVAIAIPTSQYDLVDCDIRCVADTGPVSIAAELAATEAALVEENWTAESSSMLEIGGPQGYALRESVRYGARTSGGDVGLEDAATEGVIARALRWLTGRKTDEGTSVLVKAVEEQAAAVNTTRNPDQRKRRQKDARRRQQRANEAAEECVDEVEEIDIASNISGMRRDLKKGSPWELAMRRANTLLFVRLRCVRSGAVFCVATCVPLACSVFLPPHSLLTHMHSQYAFAKQTPHTHCAMKISFAGISRSLKMGAGLVSRNQMI
jgi:hypothetical protein